MRRLWLAVGLVAVATTGIVLGEADQLIDKLPLIFGLIIAIGQHSLLFGNNKLFQWRTTFD